MTCKKVHHLYLNIQYTAKVAVTPDKTMMLNSELVLQRTLPHLEQYISYCNGNKKKNSGWAKLGTQNKLIHPGF